MDVVFCRIARARLQLLAMAFAVLTSIALTVPLQASARSSDDSDWVDLNPAAQDIENFKAGHQKTFRTGTHPKAHGLNLSISYPSTWVAGESERPHIVKKFVKPGSETSPGSAMFMIMVNPIPPGEAISDRERQYTLSPEGMKEYMPDGAKLIRTETTTIENMPAGIAEYEISAERMGNRLQMRAWNILLISGQHMISIQFLVAGASSASVAKTMATYKPLFRLIANTIVLPDQYMVTDGGSGASSFHTGMQFAVLMFISFVVTWSIGLTPPLVTRYLIVKKPLPRKTASWLAGAFALVGYLLFAAIHAVLDEKPGNGFVWGIIFFVSRWIMTRRAAPMESESSVESPSLPTPHASALASSAGNDSRFVEKMLHQNDFLTNAMGKSNTGEALNDLGQLFLRDLKIAAPRSKDATVRMEYEFLKGWLNVKGNHFTIPQAEVFAHEFRKHLDSDTTADIRLRSLFERFRSWLVNIYQALDELHTPVSNNVRAMCERIGKSEEGRSP